jgi:hypothetical protein
LINTSQVGKFYPFVSEFLQLCGISLDDMIIAEKDVLYKKIFISSSYTHGHNSDLAPRLEIYPFFRELTNIDCSGHLDKELLPEKIYISRRSHLHGDTSNIGTDYTSRRKLLLEDELVHYLESLGFTEIFTEKLTTHEKICLFKNAKVVVGCIGGGTCNVLFSNPYINFHRRRSMIFSFDLFLSWPAWKPALHETRMQAYSQAEGLARRESKEHHRAHLRLGSAVWGHTAYNAATVTESYI